MPDDPPLESSKTGNIPARYDDPSVADLEAGKDPAKLRSSFLDSIRDRYIYATAKRTSDDIQTINISQFGYTLETLADAMYFMRQIAVDPHHNVNDFSVNPSNLKPIDTIDIMPAFDTFCRDPRVAASYRVASKQFGTTPRKELAPLNVLSEVMHMQLRHHADPVTTMAKSFGVTIEKLKTEYDELIKEYKALTKRYRNKAEQFYKDKPTERPENLNGYDEMLKTEEGREEYAAFNKRYVTTAKTFFSALAEMPTVKLTWGDHSNPTSIAADSREVEFPNHTPDGQLLRLHEKTPFSSPALVLWALSYIGHEGTDNDKRPPAEFLLTSNMVGSESIVADCTQALKDMAAKEGIVAPDFSRQKFENALMIKNCERDLQMMREFCHLADCAYPAVYTDLNILLHMAGNDQPNMGSIKTPQEASLLLFAMERGLLRHGVGQANDPLHARLLSYANSISQYNSSQDLSSVIPAGDMRKLQNLLAGCENMLKGSKDLPKGKDGYGNETDAPDRKEWLEHTKDVLAQLKTFLTPQRDVTSMAERTRMGGDEHAEGVHL